MDRNDWEGGARKYCIKRVGWPKGRGRPEKNISRGDLAKKESIIFERGGGRG